MFLLFFNIIEIKVNIINKFFGMIILIYILRYIISIIDIIVY